MQNCQLALGLWLFGQRLKSSMLKCQYHITAIFSYGLIGSGLLIVMCFLQIVTHLTGLDMFLEFRWSSI
jgi:hypothetical protein